MELESHGNNGGMLVGGGGGGCVRAPLGVHMGGITIGGGIPATSHRVFFNTNKK